MRYDGDNDDDKKNDDDNAGEHAAAGGTARIGRNPGRLPPPKNRYGPFSYLLSLLLLCVRRIKTKTARNDVS